MENKDDKFRDGTCDFSKLKVKTKTILAFVALGFVDGFFYNINVSASQDILEATAVPTSLVLLATTGPACLEAIVYPYFHQKIPLSVASIVIFVLSVTGMLIISLVQEPRIRLIGVCVLSFGIGGIESIFYPLTAFYGTPTVNGFALGMGIACLTAPVCYTGLTMLACLSPEVSLLVVTVLWILFPISYLAVEGRGNGNQPSSHPTSYKEIPYSPVESDPNEIPESELSCNNMLSLVWKTQVPFIALFSSEFSRNLLLNGVVTTLAFTNVSLTPRNQFLVYVLASGTGDIFGKSYLGLLSLYGLEHLFKIQKTWIVAFLNVCILIFMIVASWFRLISQIYIVITLVSVNSLLSSIVFTNSLHNTGEGLVVSESRFCRAFLSGALWAAEVAVALIGLDTETRLRRHCLLFFPEVVCYTRSSTAWNSSTSCLLGP